MNEEERIVKIPHYKKFWYSITKFEKYPEMAAEGVGRAFLYYIWLFFIFAIIIAIGLVIRFSQIDEQQLFELEDNIIQQLDYPEEVKDALINFIEQDMKTTQGYILYGIVSTIYTFFIYSISALIDILILSVFGLLTSLISKMKMRYRAIFNMSIYSITISTVLQLIYIYISMFTNFEIAHFDVMYTTVAFICLAAAILMIKSDVIKQQLELMKIIEIKKEEDSFKEDDLEKKREDKEEEQEEKQDEKKEENKEENKGENNDTNPNPQGSNA